MNPSEGVLSLSFDFPAQGLDHSAAGKIIRAEVPLAEMFGYATDLRSMSQGRAVYSMEFEKYSEVPQNVADVVMKRAS